MFNERKQRKMQFQKTSVNVATYFLCRETIELGSKLKGKFMSQHNSPVSRLKFKRALKEMSQHYLLCHYI